MKKQNFLQKISEGSTDIFVYKNKEKTKGPGAKKGCIPFYNPAMELNRDLSIVFVQWLVNNSKQSLKILDGLSSSGLRGVRISNEINGKFKVFLNDWSTNAFNLIKKNIEENNLKNAYPLNTNLNNILSSDKFDYIDIDPFGSPVYFFDSAVRSIKHNGVISFSATDTATLCGVYKKVCKRRYDAISFHGTSMKEIGLRILIGALARACARHDKGILPLISYVTDHYFRSYIRIYDNVNSANDTILKVKTIKKGEKIAFEKTKEDTGPLWAGKTQSKNIFKDFRSIISEKKLGKKVDILKLIDLLEEEADMPMFYFTTDSIASFLKCSPPKKADLFKFLEKKGHKVCSTHFESTSFKTNASIEVIEKMFKE